MIRILGSSFERTEIKDLGDVIYYRQIKVYTDQQYESSKDLQREVRKGRLTKLKEFSSPGNSESQDMDPNMKLNGSSMLGEIKRVIKECLPATKADTNSLKDAVREMTPLIVDMVRQEISSKLSNVQFSPTTSGSNQNEKSSYVGPEYIPDISTTDMKSNVHAENKEVSGEGLNSNLEALRRLKKQPK